MKITPIKNLKPINYDIHLEYLCPNNCGSRHWLSLKESQEKNFKIVCDCGAVFMPKPVKDINIKYRKCKKKKKKIDSSIMESAASPIVAVDDLPLPDCQEHTFDINSLIEESIVTLCGFGFKKTEAKDLLLQSYHKQPTENSAQLIKQTLLDSFGG